MKIRRGFVSNSSSSSFVIRGIKIKKDQLKEMPIEDRDDYEKIGDFLNKKINVKCFRDELRAHSDLNWFRNIDGETSENVIVGCEGDFGLDDGDMVCADDLEFSDDEIKAKLSKVLDIPDNIKLKTFVQFVSNDNY